MDEILNYTGKALANGDEKYDLRPYLPSQELVKAVNIALFLKKRPLLLMGEPGVGKTCLAESVAYELLGNGEDMKTHFFRWNIKSTTKAKDGLYRYDTFRRLADSQIMRSEEEKAQIGNLKLGAKNSYIQPGYLAAAFSKSTKSKRSILLIDEIDKADIDFPNDLLNELENYEFTIPETGEEVKKPVDFEYPLIFITSNRERELPPAFLRRCLYHFIKFPDEKILAEIIQRVFKKPAEDTLVKKAIRAFSAERDGIGETEKKPSTSELLDWFQVLKHYDDLKNKKAGLTENDKIMIKALDELDRSKVPFAEVLLKTYETFSKNE